MDQGPSYDSQLKRDVMILLDTLGKLETNHYIFGDVYN